MAFKPHAQVRPLTAGAIVTIGYRSESGMPGTEEFHLLVTDPRHADRIAEAINNKQEPADTCGYPECKCIVTTSTTNPTPVCKLGLPERPSP